MNDMIPPNIIWIGRVLWDIIGRAKTATDSGDDVPGDILREPGGVAFNIAFNFKAHGHLPGLLTAIGKDAEGSDLITSCSDMGFNMDYAYRPSDLPSDHYIGIEDSEGLVIAIAQSKTIEICSDKVIRPLLDGRLGSLTSPFDGTVVIDSNLSSKTLANIASSAGFTECDIKLAVASPYKARKFLPFLGLPNCTFYCNLQEAEALCQQTFSNTRVAVEHLLKRGAHRAVVTHGGKPVSEGGQLSGIISALPVTVNAKRVTGAGDAFMASHINAELMEADRETALNSALLAARQHITSEANKL